MPKNKKSIIELLNKSIEKYRKLLKSMEDQNDSENDLSDSQTDEIFNQMTKTCDKHIESIEKLKSKVIKKSEKLKNRKKKIENTQNNDNESGGEPENSGDENSDVMTEIQDNNDADTVNENSDVITEIQDNHDADTDHENSDVINEIQDNHNADTDNETIPKLLCVPIEKLLSPQAIPISISPATIELLSDDDNDNIPLKSKLCDAKKVSVSLARLPTDLNPLLHTFKLNEILNENNRVLASVSSNGNLVNKKKNYQKNNKKKESSSDDESLNSTRSIAARSNKNRRKCLTTEESSEHNATIPKLNLRKRNAKIKPMKSEDDDFTTSDNDDKSIGSLSLTSNSKNNKKNSVISSSDEEIMNGVESKQNGKTKSEMSSSKEQDQLAEENGSSDGGDSDFEVTKKRKVISKKRRSPSLDSDSESDGKKKRPKRRRIKQGSDSSDNEDGSPSKGRKNIRKVIKSKDLEDDTKRAAREEMERKKRIEDRQKMYNEYYEEDSKEYKKLDKLILDFDEETKDELIKVDKNLVQKLKPHQGSGVKFMWDTCFESIDRISKGPGSGCILAHCMGLGKTLQVVTLVHTLFSHSELSQVEKVLVICPLSTVLNWVNEFKMWLKQCSRNKDIEIYEISKYKQNCERVYHINEWHQEGGVLILGYDMFRNLSSETSRLKKKEKATILQALIDPGADLVVCDEGHLLKNSKTSLSKAVNRLKTLRRIVLTGTPLQNNLNEYYCMVQFVKPNLLGKYNEYLNRFVNPITNGQYVDSTPRDIQMMKKRSHILHKLLDGCVQRRDYSVLAPYLPIKHEYVVYIKLTKLQVELYKHYIAHKPNQQTEPGKNPRTSVLFSDFQNLQRIWTHPRVLRYNSDRFEIAAQKKRDEMSEEESEGSIKDFIDNSSESEDSTASETPSDSNDSDVLSVHSDESLKKKKKKLKKAQSKGAASSKAATSGIHTRRTRANANTEESDFITLDDIRKEEKHENPTEWWMSICPENELDNIRHSGKLMLLFSLLEECEQIGDKLLVFSQSLYSLDVIEHFLGKIDEHTQSKRSETEDTDDDNLCGYKGSWSLGTDYFRLDGSTSIENRNLACKQFNRDDNTRARLFLISTRAGGLGINLVAANRVVIFDVSWNPSHDIQSIFRIYRFGQKKPCYIYRFIALGGMEEKIYERQVTKLAISKRVIDEHQIDRHYKEHDLMELYKTDLEPEEPRPTPPLPKDRLFAENLKKFDNIIYKYHEHDSLLENKSEETLNEEEIKAAWEEFEAEKKQPQFSNYMPQQRVQGMGPVTSNQIFGFRSDVLLKLLNIQARKTYPSADDNQIKALVPLLLQQLYERMHNGDTSMYQSLVLLQSELERPVYAFNQMLDQMGSTNLVPNPYALMTNQNPIMQQQQMIAEAQNRLMGRTNTTPTQSNQIIELD